MTRLDGSVGEHREALRGKEPAPAASDPRASARLLAMAEAYLAAGAIHHAAEIYFTLVEECGEAPEGRRARVRLTEMAEIHELAAEPHRARTIYGRLEGQK
jgi:hypothetical protein